jgi:hypothetical protein
MKDLATEETDDNTLDLNDSAYNIYRGDISDRTIHIAFGDAYKNVSKLLIMTNDGNHQYIDVHQKNHNTQIIKWDNLGLSNPDHNQLDVFKIF